MSAPSPYDAALELLRAMREKAAPGADRLALARVMWATHNAHNHGGSPIPRDVRSALLMVAAEVTEDERQRVLDECPSNPDSPEQRGPHFFAPDDEGHVACENCGKDYPRQPHLSMVAKP